MLPIKGLHEYLFYYIVYRLTKDVKLNLHMFHMVSPMKTMKRSMTCPKSQSYHVGEVESTERLLGTRHA